MKRNKQVLGFVICILLSSVVFAALFYYIVYNPEIEYLDIASLTTNTENGDIVVYGKYEQDGNLDNGPEDIEWYVIDNSLYGRILLISKNVLDYKPFDISVTWADSDLKKWLNTDFYNNSFSNKEKKYLKEYSSHDFYNDDYRYVYVGIPETEKIMLTLNLSNIDKNGVHSIYNSKNTNYSQEILDSNKKSKTSTLVLNSSYINGYMKEIYDEVPVKEAVNGYDSYDEYEITTFDIQEITRDISDDTSIIYGIRPVIAITCIGKDE